KHLDDGKRQHHYDLEKNLGRVVLPNALDRKYPNAGQEWRWQWFFPATRYYKAVREAARNAGIAKPATCHSLRHFFSTHLLEDGYDIRTVRELLGHRDVSTTIYTHVLNRGGRGVQSPADRLLRI
ncbi:MAG: tyrosine-type recombinase/integrase, partial [Candidatus Binatia bacterium]|nr:tyrosine-type recombinase/integrase [Candidatus Binatia bacterium]